jgi:hypothetical protein
MTGIVYAFESVLVFGCATEPGIQVEVGTVCTSARTLP